jgi:hypothetical protein
MEDSCAHAASTRQRHSSGLSGRLPEEFAYIKASPARGFLGVELIAGLGRHDCPSGEAPNGRLDPLARLEISLSGVRSRFPP